MKLLKVSMQIWSEFSKVVECPHIGQLLPLARAHTCKKEHITKWAKNPGKNYQESYI